MNWGDIFPVLVLVVCAFSVHENRNDFGSSALASYLIGLAAWAWIGYTLAVDIFDEDAQLLRTAEDERGSLLRLVAFIGAVVWFVVVFHDDAPSRSSGSGGRAPAAAQASDSALRTADGARVQVGDGVWSQNHWPWSITSVEAGWVHLDYDWDENEQSSTMIALEDFDRYYYQRHPSGPMTCYTAGCRHRPWGAR